MINESNLKRIDEKLDSISDSFSPLTIKEIRQSFNGKSFLGSFGLGLVACSVAAIIVSESGSRTAGDIAFHIFSGILNAGLFIVFPLLAFMSLHSDRNDSTFELVGITSLSSGRLIYGKWQSSLIQALLFTSSILPFLTFSYFLRGVSFFNIIITIMLSLLISQFLILASIFSASIAQLKRNRTTMCFVLIIFCCYCFGISIFVNHEISNGGLVDLWNDLWKNPEMFGLVAFVIIFFFTLEWFLMQVAAGQLSFLMDNKSTKPRIGIVALFLEVGILYAVVSFFETFRYSDLLIFFVFFYSIILLLAIFILGEEDELPKLLYKKYSTPKNIFDKTLKGNFYPGKTSGFYFLLWLVLLGFLIENVFFFLNNTPSNYNNKRYSVLIALFFNLIFILSLLYLMNKLFLEKFLNSIKQRVFSTLLLLLIFIIPLLFGLLVDGHNSDFYSFINSHDPIYILNQSGDVSITMWINILLGSLFLLIAISVSHKESTRKKLEIRNFDAGERGYSS